MTGLDPEDLDEIPDAAIEDAMENIADKEFDMSQCRAIVKKVFSHLYIIDPRRSLCIFHYFLTQVCHFVL